MKQAFFQVKNSSNGTPEILVYGYIGEGEGLISAAEFAKELKALEKEHDTINVRINSGGGSIFEGIAIYTAIKNSTASINTYVDGIAASMGSVIALAGKKVYMSSMARMMTHKASGAIGGNADDMRQYAMVLDGLEDTLCSIYATKTGLSKEDAKAQFVGSDDKWMNAKEALAAKLIDEIFNVDTQIKVPPSAKAEHEIWAAYSETLNPKIEMKQFLFTAANLAALNLRADADDMAVQTAFDNLVAKAAKVDELKNQIKELETTAKAEKEKANDQRVSDMLETALNKDKKITAKLKAVYAEQYKGNPEGLKAVLDAMLPISSVTSVIEDESKNGELAQLSAKTYDELDKGNQLERLKALSEDTFKAKFKDRFGKEYGK